MGRPVTLLIIGAGSRGSGYAHFAEQFPDRVRVVGVAEPRRPYRERLVKAHDIPPEHVFSDWRDAAAVPRFADAVIIATQDRMHVEPAVAFAKLGYHMLLEKPMAPDAEGCYKIVDAVKRSGILFGVCHVLPVHSEAQTLDRLRCYW